ncbi:Stk1 family PASTA domain-containing Ser/Thr kinase [Clostridium akagii]|uniref:Stk1 family PASTA domain-containing Ser/Thr kinase n=1 Tax=Clostridium akagii TaxID=91623 RepID=UPI0006920592|nr:Stk1 family PASTA domain-containing Ser/Thr kinase [Clostridium akagii]
MVEVGMLLNNRYEILEKIGEGGSAVVFKAKCHILNRLVAVKVLKDDLSADMEFVEKFKREAYAVASLSNNNIVNIYDIETEENINYIIQEYIDGKTLKQVITENGKLDYKDAVNKCRQIASALDCAHKNKIIHRDIKPHNVMVTKEGVLKVTDFGIAKAADSATIIRTEKVMGSAQYLSPEQAKGMHVDARTDIYSLGIVLYEMLTGKLPFDGETAVSIALKQIQEKPVPPINLNNEIPISLNNIVLKAMDKDPINRYQSAKELIDSLDNFSSNLNTDFTSNSSNNEFTRVMDPISDTTFFKPSDIENIKKREELEEPEDKELPIDEIQEPKTKKSSISKKTKTMIAVLLAIIVLGAVVVIGYTIGMGGSKSQSSNTTGTLTVPNIVGIQQSAAKTLITGKGLKFTVADTKSSDKPKGQVIDCYPAVGSKVSNGDEIRVTISAGPAEVTVPPLIGTDLTSAKQSITSSGFTLGNVSYENSDTVQSGYIIRDNPADGAGAAKGAAIDLVVSSGPAIKMSTVPDVRNKSKEQAIDALSKAGLNYTINTVQTADNSLDNKVASQDLAPGSSVKQQSMVIIIVNQYVDNTANVPSVVGQTQSVALATLKGQGFNMSINPTNATATTQAQSNTVQSQDKSGKQTKGSTITVTMYGTYTAPAANDTNTTTPPTK